MFQMPLYQENIYGYGVFVMRIEDDVKLDFNDVLIKPKRSTLISRKEAGLVRQFTFRYSQQKWEGIPIIASNMDHTGTLDMYE